VEENLADLDKPLKIAEKLPKTAPTMTPVPWPHLPSYISVNVEWSAE
jgi:hypothetical protein